MDALLNSTKRRFLQNPRVQKKRRKNKILLMVLTQSSRLQLFNENYQMQTKVQLQRLLQMYELMELTFTKEFLIFQF